MKHAAVLYTCIGLMGAAAVTGFIDYSAANKSGIMAGLYKEETQSTGSTFIPDKEVTLDDYSRGPLDEYAPTEEVLVEKSAVPGKKKKPKKPVPPPPPPVPLTTDAPPVPKVSSENITPPVPPKPEAPVAPTESVPSVEAPPIVVEGAPVVEQGTAIGFESFSRAPLKKKKTVRVRKTRE